MIAYLNKVRGELKKFQKFSITQVPMVENYNADALARLATSLDAELKVVPLDILKSSSVDDPSKEVMMARYDVDGYIAPIYQFLKNETTYRQTPTKEN